MRYIRFYLRMFVVALAILSLGNWANGMEDEEDSKPIVKQDVYGHYGELLTCIENNSFTKAKYYWDLLKENLFFLSEICL